MSGAVVIEVENSLQSLQVHGPYFEACQERSQFQFKDWILAEAQQLLRRRSWHCFTEELTCGTRSIDKNTPPTPPVPSSGLQAPSVKTIKVEIRLVSMVNGALSQTRAFNHSRAHLRSAERAVLPSQRTSLIYLCNSFFLV